MKLLEMKNKEEIMILLLNFYNDNKDYSEIDIKKIVSENEILQEVPFQEILEVLDKIKILDIKNKEKELNNELDFEEKEFNDKIDSVEKEEEGNFKFISSKKNKEKTIKEKTIKEKIFVLKDMKLKNIDSKKNLSSIYNFIILSIKMIIPYIKKIFRFILKSLGKIGKHIINLKPDMNKRVIEYKKTVQKELEKANKITSQRKVSEEILKDAEKTISNLKYGSGIIPMVSTSDKINFAFKSMFLHDIKMAIFYIVVNAIMLFLSAKTKDYRYYTPFIIWFNFLFPLIYSYFTLKGIEKFVAENGLKDFMWKEFNSGLEIEEEFYRIIDKVQQPLSRERMRTEDREEFITEKMEMREVINNKYEEALKQWNRKHFKDSEIIALPILEKDKNEYITRFSFEVPLELDLEIVERKISDFSRFCGKTILHEEKSIKDSKITLFLEEKELPTNIKFDESKIDKNSDTRVYIGEAFDGSVYLDFDDNPHMLIGGSSGCGKGVTQNVILTQLTQKGEVIIIDLSTKAGADYNYYKERGYRIITQLEETLDFFKGLQEEARVRMGIFRKYGKNKLSAYNKVVSEEEKIYRKFIIIDEYASLKRVDKEDEEKSKEIEKTIIALGEQARAVGIHIIIATQNAKATIINTELRNNLLLRVVGRCADSNASNVFLENDFASVKREIPLIKSHEAGKFIVSGANTKDRLTINEHFVVQVPFMEFSGDHAEEHITKYGYLVSNPKVSKIINETMNDTIHEKVTEIDEIEVPKLPSSKFESEKIIDYEKFGIK